MKKWNRIGICFIVIVCLLLLSACRGGQTSHTDDQQQSTGQSEENNTSQQGGTHNNLPETLAFQWKNTFIKLQDWENVSLHKAKLLTYEDFNAYDNGLLLQKNVSYPKEFFARHSLILVELLHQTATAWEVNNVSYENGVLRCAITQYHDTSDRAIAPSADANAIYIPQFWACFIEIDTVLPVGSEITLDFTDVYLDSKEYLAKYPEFEEKIIK